MPVDWRHSDEAHSSFVVASEPGVARDALRIAGALHAGFSSQDWIDTGEGAVFLDLNPAGQWLFLPQEVSEPATEALASWLVGRRDR